MVKEIIGLRVEHSKPEEQAQRLAVQLAEALTGEANWRRDADTFGRKANEFEATAVGLLEVLRRIKERDRIFAEGREYKSTSRMDPILTYNKDAVLKQYNQTKEQAAEFQKNSKQFLKLSEDARKSAEDIQRKIKLIQDEMAKKG
jgi:hypothetical protein